MGIAREKLFFTRKECRTHELPPLPRQIGCRLSLFWYAVCSKFPALEEEVIWSPVGLRRASVMAIWGISAKGFWI